MDHILTPAGIKRLGTILFVGAHPDDETFTAGGILATARQNGQRVVCVTATKGEAGSQDETRWPIKTIGQVRAKELAAALKILGVTEHHWLSYTDGSCADVDKHAAAAELARLMYDCKPNTILTFGPDGLTGHPDHQAVCEWTLLAAAASEQLAQVYHAVVTPMQYREFLAPLDTKLNLFFNISRPPLKEPSECAIAFQLPGAILQKKRRALAAMPSQYTKLFNLITEAQFVGVFGCEYFVRAESSKF